MTIVLAIAIFVSVSSGVYLTLSRDIFRCVIGLALLGAAANLVLFTAGRLGSALPAVVPLGDQALTGAANPLPQALVLTAIVIGFALICYSLVLLLRLMRDARTDDSDTLRYAEPLPDDPVKPPASPPGLDVSWPPEQTR